MKSSPKDMENSSEEETLDIRRGPWTLEEDTLLIHYITAHGEGRWNSLAKSSGLKRTGKSCRLRWLNYLKPDIKRGNLTPQEQLLILELHSKWGNRWSKIAQHLPGRTDNEIKNYWRTRVQKQARQLKIDSNSKMFVEALRHFWMPRLLEKVEQSSASPSSSCSVSSISTMDTQKSSSPLPETKQPLIGTLSSTAGEPNKKEDSSWNFHDEKSSPSVPEQPGNSEHQTRPSPHAHDSTAYNNSLPEDCYFVDISHFDMEGFEQLEVPSRAASHTVLTSDSPMAEADWIGDDLASTFWNMDEFVAF